MIFLDLVSAAVSIRGEEGKGQIKSTHYYVGDADGMDIFNFAARDFCCRVPIVNKNIYALRKLWLDLHLKSSPLISCVRVLIFDHTTSDRR